MKGVKKMDDEKRLKAELNFFEEELMKSVVELYQWGIRDITDIRKLEYRVNDYMNGYANLKKAWEAKNEIT